MLQGPGLCAVTRSFPNSIQRARTQKCSHEVIKGREDPQYSLLSSAPAEQSAAKSKSFPLLLAQLLHQVQPCSLACLLLSARICCTPSPA